MERFGWASGSVPGVSPGCPMGAIALECPEEVREWLASAP
jgi:hypothetical protein